MDSNIYFEVNNGQLFVNGLLVSFENDVSSHDEAVTQVGEKLLVVLDSTRHKGGIKIPFENRTDENRLRNAYAVDNNAHILWRAEALNDSHPYLGFKVSADGRVTAIFDWGAVEEINPETGKLIR